MTPRAVFVSTASALLLLASAVAHAAPANDNWVDATPLGALPVTTSTSDIFSATVEATDPDPPCRQLNEPAVTNTVWFNYTTGADTEYLTLQTPGGSSVLAIIAVYTGTPGAFRIVPGGCASHSFDTHSARIAGLRLAPGTSYSIEVGAIFPINVGQTLFFKVDSARQYLVTKTADTNDGFCNSDCSLREAISASAVNPGAVIIPAGTYVLSRTGADEDLDDTGDLDATQGMGIYGSGMSTTIIDANHIDRVMTLDPARGGHMAFVLGDLTLRNGNATVPSVGNPFGTWGGGLLAPGGNGVDDFVGLVRIATRNNVANELGGGIALSTFASMEDSWVADNVTHGEGGAGLSLAVAAAHPVVISGSTFSGNDAQNNGSGGGIFVQATLLLINSTVSGNHAVSYGGGIDSEATGSLQMANCTVAYNTAFVTNPFKTQTGAGVLLNNSAANTIVDSIIARNTAGAMSDDPDCALASGTLTGGFDLVPLPNNCPFAVGDTHVDPGIATSLASNGGLTPTHALNPGSAAIDSGDPGGCKAPDGVALAVDQRGAPRPLGPRCDRGAVETERLFGDGFE